MALRRCDLQVAGSIPAQNKISVVFSSIDICYRCVTVTVRTIKRILVRFSFQKQKKKPKIRKFIHTLPVIRKPTEHNQKKYISNSRSISTPHRGRVSSVMSHCYLVSDQLNCTKRLPYVCTYITIFV